jgi:hypothetical protein
MSNILELFDKINPISFLNENEPGGLNEVILCNQINPEADFAIIALGQDQDPIRKEFYNLKKHTNTLKIIDLGNLKQGQTPKDTYFALSEVCAFLLRHKIIPIVLGGNNDHAIGMYKGYEQIGQIINIANIDSRIDLKELTLTAEKDNYLAHIFCSDPNYLFNYTHLCYQSYFVETDLLKLLYDIRFETYRLGEIQNNLEDAEPLIRNCDMLLADINAIRASDSPVSTCPHGLYGEEFCKLLHYGGASDKLTSLGIFSYDAKKDNNNRTAQIIAHALWYFIEGYLWRKQDFPYKDLNNYYRFNVLMENDETIIFYKSKKSGRWWMQINCSDQMQQKYLQHYLIPCTYKDYQSAMENKIPDRFLIAHTKLNL